MTQEQQAEMLGRVQPFMELLMQYRCAIREIETKLNVLNEEFSLQHERNPFESIKSRVKAPYSIIEKMNRKGYELTVKNIEEKLNDVAGIRVICSFVEDIYYLAAMLSAQDDLEVLKVKDYIKKPKPNGYRSLHLIVQIPIFLSNEKKYMRVEVQFRTIAMDFWASLDHKLKYKKNVKSPERIAQELKKCADVISSVDMRMQEIRSMIEEGEM
ncbi:MAG: GTP pyrophosphokinase family protein [Clostridiales bacterium]|nr:GTP pyrophosphokinase family protein [Clostridiales bacterium]